MDCPDIAKQGKSYILNIRSAYQSKVLLVANMHMQNSTQDQSTLTGANAFPTGPNPTARAKGVLAVATLMSKCP